MRNFSILRLGRAAHGAETPFWGAGILSRPINSGAEPEAPENASVILFLGTEKGFTYGTCDFEIAGRPKVAEPSKRVRGKLARAMLYMTERYAVDVRMQRDELLGWHRADPPMRGRSNGRGG